MKHSKTQGFFLIEVVVAASIITAVLILLLGSIQNSVEASQRSLERTQASYLLEEGVEAVKSIRDTDINPTTDGWSTITSYTNGTTYYLSWSGSAWSLTTTPVVTDAFTRTVTFAAISRDATTNDIVTSGGIVDAGTKKMTVTVSWVAQSGTKSEAIDVYIANIR